MEEEMTMTVEGQGEPGSSEGESGVEMPTSPTKRAQGRPKGSKNMQASPPPGYSANLLQRLTSLYRRCQQLTESKDIDSLDNSFQPKKGRGRPKRSGSLKRRAESSKNEEEEGGDSSTPRKRGRPKGSPNKKPRRAKRREVSGERESPSDCDSQSPAKRGRGSPRKSLDEATLVAKQTVEDSSNGGFKSSPRGRGRPKEDIRQSSLCSGPEQRVPDGSSPAKRGPGRPKGSPNKTYPPVHRSDRKGSPRKPNLPFILTERLGPKPKGRGRPKKEMHKRGRPRKNPLPPPGDPMRPKVWKPLGRPRKYPKLELPESPPPPPRRARGRPRKVESKRGFHLRKAAAQLTAPNDASPRPRGRPVGSVKSPRGRPKGSPNKAKAASHTWVVDDVPAEHRQRERRKKESHDAGQAGEGDDAPVEASEKGNPTEDM